MRTSTRILFLLTALLLLIGGPRELAAQVKGLTFDAQGTDSATGHPIVLHLQGKKLINGRQYKGTCSIKPIGGKGPQSALVGEWQFVQNSNPELAGGARPALAGMGTRAGAKPLRTGQRATKAGQAINFTIEAQPDGRYQILLMDSFSDESLDFKYSAAAGK